jgi:hypothetical protein
MQDTEFLRFVAWVMFIVIAALINSTANSEVILKALTFVFMLIGFYGLLFLLIANLFQMF